MPKYEYKLILGNCNSCKKPFRSTEGGYLPNFETKSGDVFCEQCICDLEVDDPDFAVGLESCNYNSYGWDIFGNMEIINAEI